MPVYKDFHAFIFDDFFKIYIISKSDWWFSLDYLHPTARRNIYAILGILINIWTPLIIVLYNPKFIFWGWFGLQKYIVFIKQ